MKDYKYIVVGSGLFGSVVAERISNDMNEKVLLVEKRNHIGGNCYSDIDEETGIEFHKYGPHIFHTSIKNVWEYINKFTDFNQYIHQVLTTYKDKVYQMPINLETINSFYDINLKPFEVDDFLNKEKNKNKIQKPSNFEELGINLIGKPLYEAFIKGYTQKQWQKDPKEMPMEILKRLPFRKNYDENYYFSYWQGIPLNGYTALFNKLLSNNKIKILVNTDFFEIKDKLNKDALIIYSGAIDRFFDYKFGKLDWRTLRFEKEIKEVEDYQGVSQMNYTDKNIPYTRIIEPKHFHKERKYQKNKTIIIKEYSQKVNHNSEPYYPINDKTNQKLILKYRDAASKNDKLIVGGRLGEYKYYDMDQTIERALDIYNNKIKNK